MKRFLARLLFRSVSGKRTKLAEDSFRLIHAKDAADAREKAIALGKTLEHEYKNHLNQTVAWELVECLDVCPLEDGLKDGAEVYSLLLVPKELKILQQMFTLEDGKRWVRE